MNNNVIYTYFNFISMKTVVVLCAVLINYISIFSQNKYKEHCVTEEEMLLYNLINEYRKEKNLEAIPLSKSLSYVAREHVNDLDKNIKKLTHGWSTCKYVSENSKTHPCMWLKPSELTSYNGYGYECLYNISYGGVKAKDALDTWKRSAAHNNVIINKSIWNTHKWKAIGIGIFNNYAAIWLGDEEDEEGIPELCE